MPPRMHMILSAFRPLRRPVFRPVLAALAALAPAACGPPGPRFAPACPVPGVVKPLDELARYRGGAPDLANLIIRARVTDLGGKCDPGRREGTVRVRVNVVIDVSRGPALQGDTYELPVFVAVTDASAVLDKKLYALSVKFERNVDSARAISPEIELELPVSAAKSAAAYGVLAGFQLTPEETAAARRAIRR